MLNRPPTHRPPTAEGRSQQPLLKEERRRPSIASALSAGDEERGRSALHGSRRLRSRTPDYIAKNETRRKYFVAAAFLILSLVSFTVQTETAVYIQHVLHWDKPYCMLYVTHGSWILLWPVQLLILRIQKRHLTWEAFWRRHVYLLKTTAQMVESQDLHLTSRDYHRSPVPYMLKSTAFVTVALTVAGVSWYVAVNLTTASDLTAIYNCSAFFAYAFSIPILRDKIRFDKIFSVVVAIAGVLVVAYGDSISDKKTPDGTAGKGADGAEHRTAGNIMIGIGSVLYGLYEVLYKRFACPPQGVSAGRSVIFANAVASMIGCWTVLVLWIPFPILHVLGIEKFSWPTGEAAWMLLVSTIANATFSGAFLVLISLTSPVLSSVAALLTIFLVAIVDWFLTGQPLSKSSIIGGVLITIAFMLLAWSTYREMEEEKRKRIEDEEADSDAEE
ncbi:hypothetical protein M432DRAFT_630505 [Thermoascus aurantiacus ATCC 26904]